MPQSPAQGLAMHSTARTGSCAPQPAQALSSAVSAAVVILLSTPLLGAAGAFPLTLFVHRILGLSRMLPPQKSWTRPNQTSTRHKVQPPANMDPISLSAMIVSLSAKFLSVANRCHTLYEKDKLAFVTIHAINHKSRSVNAFLDGINVILLDPRSAPVIQSLELPHWHESLMVATDACRLTYECLEAELEKLGPWMTQNSNSSKRSLSFFQRMRLHWNEDSLKAVSALLDTTIDSVRCLLDVLTTAMLVPLVNRATDPQLSRRATVLQRKLIETDKKIGAHFSTKSRAANGSSSSNADGVVDYTDEARTVVYPRYRDNMDCIRSIYSEENDENLGVMSISSSKAASEIYCDDGDDGYSFVSTAPLVAADWTEKSINWQRQLEVGKQGDDDESFNEKFNEKEQYEDIGPPCNQGTVMPEPSVPSELNHDDAEECSRKQEESGLVSMAMVDLYQELGIRPTAAELEDGWDEPTTPVYTSTLQARDNLSTRTGDGAVAEPASLMSILSAIQSSTTVDSAADLLSETSSVSSDGIEDIFPVNISSLRISVAGHAG